MMSQIVVRILKYFFGEKLDSEQKQILDNKSRFFFIFLYIF